MSWLAELKRMKQPGWWAEWGFKRRLERDAEAVLRAVGIRSGQRVLDYGCGSGTFAIPAARIVGEKGKVYALDVSGRALVRVKDRAARKGLANIETILSDETEVASLLGHGSVDVVLLYDVLHLVEDKEPLLGELHEILVADGFLSIYPMHLEDEEVLKLAERNKLFILRDQYRRILNLIKTSAQLVSEAPTAE